MVNESETKRGRAATRGPTEKIAQSAQLVITEIARENKRDLAHALRNLMNVHSMKALRWLRATIMLINLSRIV